ncbi:GIY-YIG nuclease family protein [Pseudomonas sp. YuFO20]|uniref:GIY-YIG nuclease family protein n=1 Tax=Pseudomonas sp. YuFO20 TaxID=3095362 RepID=UPI002B24DAFC|nr:GIY-YIG nuclease family protein [Pseudomonas sp. YuFO20]MEB2514812.1 GIY-YIG nuclease family protein [Pseudomonas sp. YuFO20]
MHHSIETSNPQGHVATRFMQSQNVSRDKSSSSTRSGACVYAVLFSDGWLKVGRGRNAQARIGSHAGISSMRNATVMKSVVSGLLVNPKKAEKRLIDFCMSIALPVHGREWFVGVDFESVESIINAEFQGDSDDSFAVAKARSDKAQDSLFKSINKAFAPGGEVKSSSVEDPIRWATSISHARIINSIYIGDLYGGQLFQAAPWGMTNFETLAALALHGMDDSQIAGIYGSVFANPGEALEMIVGAGESVVDAYRLEEGI